MLKKLIGISLASILFAAPLAADTLDDVIDRGTLRCGVVLDFPPIGYFDAKEKEKAMEEERARIENNNREMRKMQARSDFMQGMRDVYRTQASRRLNL